MDAETNEKMALWKRNKVSIIVISAFELFFGLTAIGVAIPSIMAAMHSYYDCYRDISYSDVYPSSCNLYFFLNRFSLTAQGIWTGSFVVISASLNIDFAVNPSRKTGGVSVGFSVLATCLSAAMITLEAFPVAEWNGYSHNHNDYEIWIYHCTLLAIACLLFILTLTITILSSTIHCCGKGIKFRTDATQAIRYRGPYDRQGQFAEMRSPPQYATATTMQYVQMPATQNMESPHPFSIQAVPVQVHVPLTSGITFQNHQVQVAQSQPGPSNTNEPQPYIPFLRKGENIRF